MAGCRFEHSCVAIPNEPKFESFGTDSVRGANGSNGAYAFARTPQSQDPFSKRALHRKLPGKSCLRGNQASTTVVVSEKALVDQSIH
jgi:hypothetical protein